MLAYTYQALQTFRKVYSRHSTWLTFCLVVLGFIGATQIDGVSSWCRFPSQLFRSGRCEGFTPEHP